MNDKKGVVTSEIIWWVIGVILLAVIIIGLILIKTTDFNIFERLKELLRFGR